MHQRTLISKVSAPFARRHWIALANAFRIVDEPLRHLHSYLTRTAEGYPRSVGLTTPIGHVDAQLFQPDDILTLNEIFCRLDYECDPAAHVFVDFGSNVGLASLYFLTRNSQARVWAYEPNPANIPRLTEQLSRYAGRVKINPIGVAPENGMLEFGFEATGRYGGAGRNFPDKMSVEVHSAEQILSEIIAAEGVIDVLKMDIESLENDILNSLSSATASSISTILVEGKIDSRLFEDTHLRSVYGPITRFERR